MKETQAVINAISCNISNGVAEGNVNKVKQIKKDMYGRASYELLRKKVIYQSLFS
ncbi:transposase [Schnuerera ultunensis]|uniref:transposase n=1 Tax=Schnuerera ultunensis TaxID=45497 RepID=UPI0003F7E59C|nr:transposase [Schnuerera ultunensis]